MLKPCVPLGSFVSAAPERHCRLRVCFNKTHKLALLRPATNSIDAPLGTKDPRRDVFFPASIYRPEEFVAKLCKREDLPEEVGDALVKAVESGKFPFQERTLMGAVENAKGIIDIMSLEVAVPLIVRYPLVLRNTPERLKQRLQFFGKLLGCSHQWVLNMVRRYPNLINVKSGRVLRHFEDLKVTFKGRFSESELVEMLQVTPAMLGMQPTNLYSKWQLLKQLAALHPPWQHSLTTTTPGAVATLLTYSPRRIQRLRYLYTAGQANIALCSVVMKPDAWFEQHYPGWLDWASSEGGRGAAAGHSDITGRW